MPKQPVLFVALITLLILSGCGAADTPSLSAEPSPVIEVTPIVDKTASRQVFSPYCQEAMCDLTLDPTATPPAAPTAAVESPGETPVGALGEKLYLAPVLVIQPDIPLDLQQQTANLFGGCSGAFSCEDTPQTEKSLSRLEIGGSMVGLQAGMPADEDTNCSLLTRDLQKRMLVLMDTGLSSFYLSFKGSGCNWAAMAQENGFLLVRAELDRLTELAERLHPWRAGSDGWDTPDAQGGLVVFPSGIPVNCKSELASSVSPNPPCVLEPTDVNVVVWEVEQALSRLDKSHFNVYVLPVFVEQEGDIALLKMLLERLQPTLNSGQLVQVHLAEAYDLYIEWEGQGEETS